LIVLADSVRFDFGSIFADMSGLPPLLAVVVENELLTDDVMRVVDRARDHGTDARLLIGKRMQHDYPLTLPWLDESRQAWRTIAEFVEGEASRCGEP